MSEAQRFAFGAGLRRLIVENLQQFDACQRAVGNLRRAAVAVTIVAAEDDQGAMLLTRRSTRLRVHAGQWALPGGRLDAGESPEEAALRELWEELGLRLGAEDVLGILDDYPTRSRYLITPVVVWGGVGATLTPNPTEVESVHRVPLTELERPGSPEFVSIPESDRPVIRMPLVGEKIHAPTAAVIYQFREVALRGRSIRVDDLEQPVWAWR